jgi:hypothetical protein
MLKNAANTGELEVLSKEALKSHMALNVSFEI